MGWQIKRNNFEYIHILFIILIKALKTKISYVKHLHHKL